MTNVLAIRVAAFVGLLGVALGAFGAHGLKGILTGQGTAAFWDKAVFYHLIHAVMLFVVATQSCFRRGPWFCFLFGIVIFSGSLYVLALTNARWLGAITPFGGLSLLTGWGWLMIRPVSKPEPTP